ncbi:MAG: LysE family translocator [Candidatus Thermoplasmatota archaeon]|nr:LysE family translocator [Candidatus Thermoplasmatota archaeon]MCL5731507.1 LysE family translocator [Candidatus Thermoplasmatota archaeon]
MDFFKIIFIQIASVYYLMLFDVVLGIALGLSLAGPPGPVTAIIINESRSSAFSGFLVGLGAMTADFILMIIVFSFYSAISNFRIDLYLYPIGAAVFLLNGVLDMKGGMGTSVPTGKGYLTGLEIGIVNPFQIAWWTGAGLSVLESFGIAPFYFLFVGIVIWVAFLSNAIRRSVIKFGRRFSESVRLFSFSVQVLFAGFFIYLWLSIFLT